jgi:hypothetical protein
VLSSEERKDGRRKRGIREGKKKRKRKRVDKS